ncbi:MAG: carbohydrate-binding family 25 protein [Clostridiaceae bacterium]|nr:carbohydrate-binding family 25 protein [Clostridiaceae bacterium]
MLNTGYTKKGDPKKKSPISQKAEQTSGKKELDTDTFKEEFSEVIATNVSLLGVQSYSKAGVTFEKISETQAKIKYNGLLAQSGAQSVKGVYGFGSNQQWENVSEAELIKEGSGEFSAVIPIEQGKNVNLAFKDSAENWDNNSGMNYTFVN